MIDYIFLISPHHSDFKHAKIFAKFQKINLYSRKIENEQILFKGICAKILAKFFLKIVQSASICSRLSKSYKKSKYNNRK